MRRSSKGSPEAKPTKAETPQAPAGKPAKRRGGAKANAVLSLLGAFVATSVALGVLVAGLILPTAGLLGSGTKNGIKTFEDIPASFSDNALSQQAKILAADNSVIATPSDESRIVIPSSQIPKIMKEAQVAIEDERFYQHGALDQRGLARAIVANLFSSSTQGASTLTQQYVKVADQARATQSGDAQEALDAVSRSGAKAYVRKLKQLREAVDLERTHTKDQILTSYLNIVYFGEQQYGIEAASLHYFGHPAKDLTLPEAATLAGTVNIPATTNPIANPAAAKTRRNIVLTKMYQQGMITEAQEKAAIASPLKTKTAQVSVGCSTSKYPYYCDYVMNYLASLPELGKTPKERLGRVRSEGLIVKTALDPKKMDQMESELKKRVPVGNAADAQAAAVTIQPGTGLVMAMGTSTNYNVAGTDPFNTSVDYALSGFPIGSTAKAFAIIEAMRQGRAINSTINIPAMNGTDSAGPYKVFNSSNFPGPCGQKTGEWHVHNDHQVPVGPMKLADATAQSVNTAFATLVASLGPCAVRDTFKLMGVGGTGDNGAIANSPGAIVLGEDSSTPISIADAYATLAADGKYCPPSPIISITTADGKPVPMGAPACKQVITKDQARSVVKIFESVLKGDGTAANSQLAGGRPAFGKTGTVDGARHTWFVGATRQLATAVWVGHGGADSSPIKDVQIGGQHITGYLYGGDIAAPTWKTLMDEFSSGMPKEQLPDPSNSDNQATVPDVKGKSEAEAKKMLTDLQLKVTEKKQGTSEKVSSGQAFGTDKPAGSKVNMGDTVTLYIKQ